jgi:glycosyltransferase involved in cell wall biosynthesis
MKILFTSPYRILPANSGSPVRTLGLARAFASLGHEVHLLCAEPRERVEIPSGIQVHYFPSPNQFSHFFNPRFVNLFGRLLEEKFDLVIAAQPFQAWMIAPILRRHRVPVVYDAHNVEADRFRKTRGPLLAWLVRLAERKFCRTADLVFTVSDEDKKLMGSVHETDSIILPNGVDTQLMSPRMADASVLQKLGLQAGAYALFFGSYDYRPNVEAAGFLVEEVWPKVLKCLPDAKLALVGRLPLQWMKGHKGIVVTGAVDEIEEVIRGASIVLAPLFSGGGTRLKIIEALSAGKTILATPFGAQGIVKQDSEALRLSSPDRFSETLIELLRVPNEDVCGNQAARRLGEAHDWIQLATRVLPQLRSLAQGKGSQ